MSEWLYQVRLDVTEDIAQEVRNKNYHKLNEYIDQKVKELNSQKYQKISFKKIKFFNIWFISFIDGFFF